VPIFVNHDERREEIITAAIEVLGTQGFAKFTLRAVGQHMGGSVTLVTHYFPNRDSLLNALLETILSEARATQDELAAIADPHERLESVVRYFLPMTEETMLIERARVACASHRNVDPLIAEHMELIDPVMRDVIRQAVADFVEPKQLDATVDLIRLWTAGVVLTCIEHPETWDAERQTGALHHFMELIDIPLKVA
jgi:AcrR family transcriptional regulator